MTEIISTHDLSKLFGKAMRVNQVNLSIPAGVVYGFLGPNGAGKSTTLKMLLGLLKPTSGTISVFGTQIDAKNRLKVLQRVGSLIESPSYYGHLTGEENLRIFQTLRGLPEEEIGRVLHIVRLENQKTKFVKHYSLGMKQRLGLANALMGNPKLLILDEPTNGLDPAGIQEIRELILSLPKEYGMTVVVSSHLLSEIDQIASYVGIISKGALVFQDNMEVLRGKSQRAIAIRTMDNAHAARVLKDKKVPVKIVDDYIYLPYMEDNVIAWYSTLLAENKVGLIRIEAHQKSLEDIFLALTGGAVSL